RAGAVNDGRRPPPQAARSVIDGPEHGGRLAQAGNNESETKNTVALPQRGRDELCRPRPNDDGAATDIGARAQTE
ncbi:MAG TPA: hypothetical protein VFW75_15925, partial [Acetobacteraceae bacterium]|nr:hypothetical protein [Acetobacteraceae bacterium]